MALETKVQWLNVDSTGRVITVKDNTGAYNSTTNPTGYGTPNPEVSDINSILFTISEYDSSKINKVKFVRTVDANHPEYLINPSVDDIANGIVNVELTSIILGISTAEEGLKDFNDGIYDINMYTLMDEVASIDGDKGTKIITGTNLNLVYDEVDYIIANDIVYKIDKSIPIESTSLTLITNLEDDITAFNPAYHSNVKALNDAASDCCGTKEAGRLAEEDCGCGCNDSKFDSLFKMWMYKIAAQIDFNCGNYSKANDLLKGAQRVCKSLNCGC